MTDMFNVIEDSIRQAHQQKDVNKYIQNLHMLYNLLVKHTQDIVKNGGLDTIKSYILKYNSDDLYILVKKFAILLKLEETGKFTEEDVQIINNLKNIIGKQFRQNFVTKDGVDEFMDIFLKLNITNKNGHSMYLLFKYATNDNDNNDYEESAKLKFHLFSPDKHKDEIIKLIDDINFSIFMFLTEPYYNYLLIDAVTVAHESYRKILNMKVFKEILQDQNMVMYAEENGLNVEDFTRPQKLKILNPDDPNLNDYKTPLSKYNTEEQICEENCPTDLQTKLTLVNYYREISRGVQSRKRWHGWISSIFSDLLGSNYTPNEYLYIDILSLQYLIYKELKLTYQIKRLLEQNSTLQKILNKPEILKYAQESNIPKEYLHISGNPEETKETEETEQDVENFLALPIENTPDRVWKDKYNNMDKYKNNILVQTKYKFFNRDYDTLLKYMRTFLGEVPYLDEHLLLDALYLYSTKFVDTPQRLAEFMKTYLDDNSIAKRILQTPEFKKYAIDTGLKRHIIGADTTPLNSSRDIDTNNIKIKKSEVSASTPRTTLTSSQDINTDNIKIKKIKVSVSTPRTPTWSKWKDLYQVFISFVMYNYVASFSKYIKNIFITGLALSLSAGFVNTWLCCQILKLPMPNFIQSRKVTYLYILYLIFISIYTYFSIRNQKDNIDEKDKLVELQILEDRLTMALIMIGISLVLLAIAFTLHR